jgi:hypothetical protein
MLLAARPILDPDGMENILDAHFIDGNAARIGVTLHILDAIGDRFLDGHGGVHSRYPAAAISIEMVPKACFSRILDDSLRILAQTGQRLHRGPRKGASGAVNERFQTLRSMT